MRFFRNWLRYGFDRSVPFFLKVWLGGKGLRIENDVSFSGFPIISIAPDSRILVGSGCRLISRAQATALGVNHPLILRTLQPGAEIFIGAGVRASGLTVCAAERVVIGERSVIGANVTIVDTDFHALEPELRSSARDSRAAKHAPVEIGQDVFIGAGSYILKGVNIPAKTVVGAGSVVTKAIPVQACAAGNPARVIRRTCCL